MSATMDQLYELPSRRPGTSRTRRPPRRACQAGRSTSAPAVATSTTSATGCTAAPLPRAPVRGCHRRLPVGGYRQCRKPRDRAGGPRHLRRDAVGDPHHRAPRFRGRQDGFVIHLADLPHSDRTRVDAVPVTTIARTLQDVAAIHDPALVEQAVARDTLSRRQLRRLVRDTPSLAPMVVGALTEE